MAFLCTLTDLQQRISVLGVSLRVDDDPSTVNQCLQRATNRIKFYTADLYDNQVIQDDADSGGWTNDRATDLAVYYLCGRRLNPVPVSAKDDYEEAKLELEAVKSDLARIPDVAMRHTSAPTFSNVSVYGNYNYRKIRMQQSISEGTTSKLPTRYDWMDLWSSGLEY
jgi:hypothetical protein